jgi:light-regulated signal transduction histidine kinase (bacteriophytochrome)
VDHRGKACYEWRIDRIRLSDGFGVVCYFRDISEQVKARETLKASEEELRRANRDLEQFAYSASHDLQEPLRSVKIYSELLEQRYRSKLDGQALEFLDFIRSGATRVDTLLRDLLTYTRAAKLETAVAPISSRAAVAVVLENLDGAIAESGAIINVAELPVVEVHDAHLQQLFQNLISNAIKYRRQDCVPEIQIAAERHNGSWRFSISDNGIGIEPQFKERIFGLFKRLHTHDEYPGSGIGLAICQRIVERYHGQIWVESQPGRGSRFFFTLPA